jgi:hypothetical protein
MLSNALLHFLSLCCTVINNIVINKVASIDGLVHLWQLAIYLVIIIVSVVSFLKFMANKSFYLYLSLKYIQEQWLSTPAIQFTI